jgi:hypothetical protein
MRLPSRTNVRIRSSGMVPPVRWVMYFTPSSSESSSPFSFIERLLGSHTAPADIAVEPPHVSPFSTISTSRPRSWARTAAVCPAPPEPITSTSTE